MSSLEPIDKTQQNYSDDYGPIQHVSSGFKLRTAHLCWDIKNFCRMMNFYGDKELLEMKKTVFLTKNSCECHFHLIIRMGSNITPLEVELYTPGRKTRFLISIILRNDDTQKEICTPKRIWNVYSNNTCTMKFFLPPMAATDTCENSDGDCLIDFTLNGILKIHVLFEEMMELDEIEMQPLDHTEKSVFHPENFAKLYKDRLLVDVTFIMPDKQLLYAHSVVLAAASPYFLAMFTTSNMKEAKAREVDLSNDGDVSYEIFQGFLDYVYDVRGITEMDSIIPGLSVLADKYDFSKLHHECESSLSNSLDDDNVISLLLFAHRCNFLSLKQKALEFLKAYNISTLKSCDEFSEICKNPELLRELISSLQI